MNYELYMVTPNLYLQQVCVCIYIDEIYSYILSVCLINYKTTATNNWTNATPFRVQPVHVQHHTNVEPNMLLWYF